MKRLLLLLPVLALLSFAPADGGKFDKMGVSFSVPTGWTITDEEDLSGRGYYLSCEKDGANSSGVITLSWVNDSMDLAQVTEQYAEGLKQSFEEQKATTNFGAVGARMFNGRKCKGLDYTMTLEKIPHEGHVYSFYGNGKTLTVMVQEALEDKAVNKAGIQVITNSLVCR